MIRNLCSIICPTLYIGTLYIGIASLPSPVHAQMDTESVIQTLRAGNTLSTSDIFEGIASSLMMEATLAEQQTSAIEGPLISDVFVPEVNQNVAETLIGGDQTGRYPPRLKINFNEFPLKDINANNVNNGRLGTSANSMIERIIRRLRLPTQNDEPQVILTVQDRTAIVSGTVQTDRQRSLVEAMLRFEPGIDAVTNKLTVGSN